MSPAKVQIEVFRFVAACPRLSAFSIPDDKARVPHPFLKPPRGFCGVLKKGWEKSFADLHLSLFYLLPGSRWF